MKGLNKYIVKRFLSEYKNGNWEEAISWYNKDKKYKEFTKYDEYISYCYYQIAKDNIRNRAYPNAEKNFSRAQSYSNKYLPIISLWKSSLNSANHLKASHGILKQLESENIVQKPNTLDENMFSPLIDKVYSVTVYRSGWFINSGDRISRLIRMIKKEGIQDFNIFAEKIASLLFDFLLERTKISNKIDVIIPISTSKTRKAFRGYGIPLEIGEYLQRFSYIPVTTKYLKLTRETNDLRYLNKKARENELKGAFRIDHSQELNEVHILLIDDVLTYGTTVKECASVIRAVSKPKSINVLVLAKTEKSL